ncbi:MAG: hypothetical protein ABI402_05710 [Ferruginibacter sp.]
MKEYIDTKAPALLNSILHEKVINHPNTQPKPELSGYMKHKNILDLGEILGPMDIIREGPNKRLVLKIRNFGDEKVGYKEEEFLEIYKVIDNLLKEENISKFISEEFLVKTIFEWLVGKYRNTITNILLSDYILKECDKSIIDYKIYLPILYLDSDKEFDIGNVHFQYLTEDYIKELSTKIAEDKREDYIENLLVYKGQFWGNCVIVAEKERAIEWAINDITFSVDILRIASPTVDFPNLPLYFDVDFRNINQAKNEVLIQNINDDANFFQQHSRRSRPFEIVKGVWDYMLKSEVRLLHQFALKILNDKSELESLIYNAIRNFSKALGNHDHHERITQIFTVLESLLLPNDNAAIIDSVCKYLPKIISKNLEEREKIIETVKEMYSVRSAMMHHAKRKEFLSSNLVIIQRCTRALIVHLIIHSTTKLTKKEILKDIDDRINRA